MSDLLHSELMKLSKETLAFMLIKAQRKADLWDQFTVIVYEARAEEGSGDE